MSMNKSAYLMIGIRIKEDEFPGDRWNDEKWIPYSEGDNDDEMSLLTGEGDNYVYIGKVLNRTSVYRDATYYEMALTDFWKEKIAVNAFLLEQFGEPMSSYLMFVELWG